MSMTDQEFHDEIMAEIKEINRKLDPIYDMYTSVTGFNKISVWILKLLAAIGIALGGLYMVIEFFKRLGKT